MNGEALKKLVIKTIGTPPSVINRSLLLRLSLFHHRAGVQVIAILRDLVLGTVPMRDPRLVRDADATSKRWLPAYQPGSVVAELRGYEFWQRDIIRDLLKHDSHWHLTLNLIGFNPDEVADEPRTFLKLNQGNHIGHFLGKRWVIDSMKYYETKDFPAT